jgi:hypothetical protein
MDFTKLHVEVDYYSQCTPYLTGNPEVTVKQCQSLQKCWWRVGGKQMIYHFAQRDHWIGWPLATMMVHQINLHVLSIGIYMVGLDGLLIRGWVIPKTLDISKHTHTHYYCKTHDFSGSLRFDPLLFSFIMGPSAISSLTSCFSQTQDEKPLICLLYG